MQRALVYGLPREGTLGDPSQARTQTHLYPISLPAPRELELGEGGGGMESKEPPPKQGLKDVVELRRFGGVSKVPSFSSSCTRGREK